MILINYITKNVYRQQLMIMIIMLMVLTSQQLVFVLNEVLRNRVPSDYIVNYLLLGLPSMLSWILPFSVFVGITVTFTRMYHSQELIVSQSCGANNFSFLKSVLPISIVVSCFLLANNLLIKPYSLDKRATQLKSSRENITLGLIQPNSFLRFPSIGIVLYIEKSEDNNLKGINIFKINNDQSLLIRGDGSISTANGFQILKISNGQIYSLKISDEQAAQLKEALSENNKSLSTRFIDQILQTITIKQSIENSFNIQTAHFNSLSLNLNQSQTSQAIDMKLSNQTVTHLFANNKFKLFLIELGNRILDALYIIPFTFMALGFGRIRPRSSKDYNLAIGVAVYLIFVILNSSLSSLSLEGNAVTQILQYILFFFAVYLGLVVQNPSRKLAQLGTSKVINRLLVQGE